MWPIFQAKSWVYNNWNMLIIVTESAIDTNFSAESRAFSKFDVYENIH